MLGRDVPGSEREARSVLSFYSKYGPLPREAFKAACARSGKDLGRGRALTAYLAALERQIGTDAGEPTSDPKEQS